MFNALNYAILKTQLQQIAAQGAYRSMLWRKTASGNPVSVYPVPESPLYAKVSGTFTQPGSGDPSPSNIRPITPWLASSGTAKVKRTGRNLLANYVSVSQLGLYAGVLDAVLAVLVKDATYTLSFNTENSGINVMMIDNAVIAPISPFTVICDGTRKSISFSMLQSTDEIDTLVFRNTATSEVASGILSSVQLELGSTATPYEPYTESEITLTAPQEIAAGWMDNEGNGQITHGYIASYVDETVPDGWVSSIGELSAGAQVVYPLATPIDIAPTVAPLTALPQIDRVTPRLNVLTASTGNIELTYAKSPIRESDDIATAIAAL